MYDLNFSNTEFYIHIYFGELNFTKQSFVKICLDICLKTLVSNKVSSAFNTRNNALYLTFFSENLELRFRQKYAEKFSRVKMHLETLFPTKSFRRKFRVFMWELFNSYVMMKNVFIYTSVGVVSKNL